MSKTLPFIVYCYEIYKNNKNLSGEQVSELFKENEITNYIARSFESLHTTGEAYIINDIVKYLEARQSIN